MRAIALPLLTAGLVTACGGSSDSGYGPSTPPPPPPPSQGTSVNVENDVFTPNELTAAVGSTVVWTWYSNGVTHHILFEDGAESNTQGSGTYSRAFGTAGAYRYRCTIHSSNFTSGMVGKVTVQ